ncbi:hypothetical protein [Tuwongella immobilis]|uniref:Uncharacterized protein n=1 Tax=Tuwongella immobilis TaxID=692036 RepID=A0A6C2YIR9_9BACT|nr:hypothetical protein [Tuwongella immobilis]VIP01430.1 Uncharacterized protein OS=Singulisphaera acidiphila (strain ATCC BAA-1392 / DSM 18658 / VKM B-2454 / MOB10) GN=Sinac_1834 PE=4 SV=1 [Tuwongella immobilis]VTR98382.1 Uncharacterized protein OS=Singulisphaera acidiphila (strain ATCC BAA-1392 / DSM 18658 / VKM B-2454 / MOB10) GN=Sinac_1834 PE=4 SV=1 [Tuwongella immobilis]
MAGFNPFFRLPSRRDSLIDFRNAVLGGMLLTHEVVMRSAGKLLAAESTAEGDWGTIRGQVVYDEAAMLPDVREVDFSKVSMSALEREFFTSTGKVMYEDWVIDPKSRGVRHTYIWLRPDTSDTKVSAIDTIHPSLRAVPREKVVMDQESMGFRPHAVALRSGQTLHIKNSSPIPHAVVWTSRENGNGNRAMPPKTDFDLEDLKAERLPVMMSCAPHPWERAVMRVFEHPYFALTDAQGRFEIKLAPGGKWRLVVWQESMGFKDGAKGRAGIPITVEAGMVLDVGKLSVVALS